MGKKKTYGIEWMSLSPTMTGNNGKGTYLADIFHVTILKALPDASNTSWSWVFTAKWLYVGRKAYEEFTWKQTFAIMFIANDGLKKTCFHVQY